MANLASVFKVSFQKAEHWVKQLPTNGSFFLFFCTNGMFAPFLPPICISASRFVSAIYLCQKSKKAPRFSCFFPKKTQVLCEKHSQTQEINL